MKRVWRVIEGSIVAPRGFMAAGIFCDIKRLGTGKGSNKGAKRDLALIVSEVPSAVAGMFTTNQVCAAPVKLCAERVGSGVAQAILVNSGNANACTGAGGMKDAREMAARMARRLGFPESHVLVGSTGRIGVRLPMKQVRRGIDGIAEELGDEEESAVAATEAIMTSDTRPKMHAVEMLLGGRTARIGGICKGAGMIQPGMSRTGRRPAAMPRNLHATMLSFLTTDAAVAPAALQAALEEAVAGSFNTITVDGDMSTNDTVLILANGLACNRTIEAGSMRRAIEGKARSGDAAAAGFLDGLRSVCGELARKIVRDGEGVHRVVTVSVSGAASRADADAAARSVANSPLVKTSWHGGDPNWGRIMDALGYSPARVVEERVDIGYRPGGVGRTVWSVRKGRPTSVSFRSLCEAAAHPEFELVIELNLGSGRAVIHAADLTEAYVEFNKGDVSDPAALGG